jgi:hypothetical protein
MAGSQLTFESFIPVGRFPAARRNFFMNKLAFFVFSGQNLFCND